MTLTPLSAMISSFVMIVTFLLPPPFVESVMPDSGRAGDEPVRDFDRGLGPDVEFLFCDDVSLMAVEDGRVGSCS